MFFFKENNLIFKILFMMSMAFLLLFSGGRSELVGFFASGIATLLAYIIFSDGNKYKKYSLIFFGGSLLFYLIVYMISKYSILFESSRHSQIFFSMYDSSNVGNPLLEAIRANKLIVTLNNGDTGSWIQHKFNGLIYSPDVNYYEQAAIDIIETANNINVRSSILKKLNETEKNRLWDWTERLGSEESLVRNL